MHQNGPNKLIKYSTTPLTRPNRKASSFQVLRSRAGPKIDFVIVGNRRKQNRCNKKKLPKPPANNSPRTYDSLKE
nr:ASN_HP1_G0028540.mRNA.1.CDS.1 [Saccharomyces cerevisiae]